MKNFAKIAIVMGLMALLAFIASPLFMQPSANAGNPVGVEGMSHYGYAWADGVVIHRFVKFDGDGNMADANLAANTVVGVSQNTAAAGVKAYFAGPGQWADVQTVTAISRGDLLVSNAAGQAVTATAAQLKDPNLIGTFRPCAIAFQAMPADANGLTVRVYILPTTR